MMTKEQKYGKLIVQHIENHNSPESIVVLVKNVRIRDEHEVTEVVLADVSLGWDKEKMSPYLEVMYPTEVLNDYVTETIL